MTTNKEALYAVIESMQKEIDAKDKALKTAIELLEVIDEGKHVYETSRIQRTTQACKEALLRKGSK
ncbi:hypothetical protein UFOVP26_59 [uncultured Caudovirales phage]|uniref:Uncharacterized protein n=1 Tax=uncultured Caudovirales phage TaxID=2100421 RepID=A0A6J5KMF1_9CAUD|nr:hypothetical protein UFOVP26_59 [uncultured Caudovirales phage]CAB4123704.1 hypothetical protein UFOVP44_38 [uncultured Caudovirales phage]CAB5219065.1 hypothetical protein UFOVP220_29 [uncultured Caudovirales phage]